MTNLPNDIVKLTVNFLFFQRWKPPSTPNTLFSNIIYTASYGVIVPLKIYRNIWYPHVPESEEQQVKHESRPSWNAEFSCFEKYIVIQALFLLIFNSCFYLNELLRAYFISIELDFDVSVPVSMPEPTATFTQCLMESHSSKETLKVI